MQITCCRIHHQQCVVALVVRHLILSEDMDPLCGTLSELSTLMNCINKVIFYADYTDESNDFKMPLTDTDVG